MFLYGQVASRNEKDDARPDPLCICYVGNLLATEGVLISTLLPGECLTISLSNPDLLRSIPV